MRSPSPGLVTLRRFFQLPESEAADLFRYGTAGAVSLCTDSNVAEDDEGSAGIVCDRRGSVLVEDAAPRALASTAAALPVRHQQQSYLVALTARMTEKIDPAGMFNCVAIFRAPSPPRVLPCNALATLRTYRCAVFQNVLPGRPEK